MQHETNFWNIISLRAHKKRWNMLHENNGREQNDRNTVLTSNRFFTQHYSQNCTYVVKKQLLLESKTPINRKNIKYLGCFKFLLLNSEGNYWLLRFKSLITNNCFWSLRGPSIAPDSFFLEQLFCTGDYVFLNFLTYSGNKISHHSVTLRLY